ncbi:MAG: polyphosphate polymerase domain-containing protein [Patescibacteria group bacterium]|jgi:hypothetical protein
MQQFTRYEFKYQITPAVAEAIRARLLRFGMEPDPESAKYPHHIYPVTSLYFDTPTMSDYHAKAGGFLRRKKIRVRIYAPYLIVHPIWLEKKEKHEMLVSKKRVRLTQEDYDNLLYGSRLALVQNHPLFLPLLTDGMRPTAMVSYQREPFISPYQSNLRITFDAHIEACLTHDLRVPMPMTAIAKDSVIMEVKFSFGIPFWFRLILAEFNLRRQSFSKYGEAMEALYRFHQIPR